MVHNVADLWKSLSVNLAVNVTIFKLERLRQQEYRDGFCLLYTMPKIVWPLIPIASISRRFWETFRHLGSFSNGWGWGGFRHLGSFAINTIC